MSEAVENLIAKREKSAEVRGEERSRMESIRAIMKNANLTAEKAMELLNIDKSQWKKYLAML